MLIAPSPSKDDRRGDASARLGDGANVHSKPQRRHRDDRQQGRDRPDLRALGVDPATLDVARVQPSNESVRTAVEAGAGVAVLSSLVVATAIKAGTLYPAPIEFGPRAFFRQRHKERYRTKAADPLLELIGSQRT